jgi:hypothetical protein
MGLPELSTILWSERRLLELLVFKLEAQQLLLGSGRDRWLPQASDELELVLEELRHTEVLRAMEAGAVAAELGLGDDPSLAELADAAPVPFDDLLRQHRDALVELAAEVRDRSRHNYEALARGHATVRELLGVATAGARAGHRSEEPGSGLLLDEVL